jgi:integrase/recombinase XerD
MARVGKRTTPLSWRSQLLLAPSSASSLAAQINRYLEHLAMRGLRRLTVHAYRGDLVLFHAWCVERGLLEPSEITKPILEGWLRHLFYYRKPDGYPLSIGRQLVMMHHVRSLFSWLVRRNVLLANPASDLDLPKARAPSLPEALTADEVESILATFDLNHAMGLTGRAMAEVLYSTAIRRAELTDLQWHDIDFARGVLHVRRGKGDKPRMVPIGERAMAWVQKYIDEVRGGVLGDLHRGDSHRGDAQQGALFVNEAGARMTENNVSQRIQNAKRLAGISKRGSCHLFRHSAATLMLEHGADVRYIQELLGHVSLETTQIYTHVSIDKLKQIHTATHPGARLKRRVDAEQD